MKVARCESDRRSTHGGSTFRDVVGGGPLRRAGGRSASASGTPLTSCSKSSRLRWRLTSERAGAAVRTRAVQSGGDHPGLLRAAARRDPAGPSHESRPARDAQGCSRGHSNAALRARRRMVRKPVLLVADDEPGMLGLIQRFAGPAGYDVHTNTSAKDAIATIGDRAPDVAIVDLRMPEVGGLDVLRAIRDAQPECRVILMTAHAEVDSAIEAVKLGAMDYLTKPLDFERLGQLLRSVHQDLVNRAALLASESETAHRFELCGMIGRSAIMQELFGLVRRIAPHARATLVTGV